MLLTPGKVTSQTIANCLKEFRIAVPFEDEDEEANEEIKNVKDIPFERIGFSQEVYEVMLEQESHFRRVVSSLIKAAIIVANQFATEVEID